MTMIKLHPDFRTRRPIDRATGDLFFGRPPSSIETMDRLQRAALWIALAIVVGALALNYLMGG